MARRRAERPVEEPKLIGSASSRATELLNDGVPIHVVQRFRPVLVRDVASLSAAYVVSQLLGEKPLTVVADNADVYVEHQPGRFTAAGDNDWTSQSVPVIATA